MAPMVDNLSPIQVAGAGPAGLAAAITLARAGRRVIVHEAQREVGYRFQGDLQGLENWTTERDALTVLKELGITDRFAYVASTHGALFDAQGNSYPVNSTEPLFYMVERGPGSGTLDTAMLQQARDLGVEVRFNSRLERLHGTGILAVGPKAADAIAVGYHFDTDMPDGFWAICDDNLAPKGYAYLLIMHGRGTVKSCMFTDFRHEKDYVARTVEAFQRYTGLVMKHPRPHGGVGNFRIPAMAMSGTHPLTGEQAGFQDTLWGFGMRYAITSGVLAARSLLGDEDYDAMWHQQLGPLMRTSVINRALYSLCGQRGYRWILRRQATRDARGFLRRLYRPSPFKSLLGPFARALHRSQRRDQSCSHVDCECIWCRHGQASAGHAN